MALETVDVLIESDDVVPVPIDGVVVRVYDATGTTLIDSGTTGAPAAVGHVEFTLPGTAAPTPTEYQLRFYYIGATVPSPKSIEVYSPPAGSPTGTNNFSVTATLLTLPVAIDPLLCRASGYIRDSAGFPKKGLDIALIPLFNPLIASDQGVLGERIEIKTNADGYVEVDLFRFGEYQATVESHENIQRCVTVPDRSSININHLLFPIVTSIVYTPAAPFALSVGVDTTYIPVVTANNFQVLTDAALEDILYESADESIMTVRTSGSGQIILRGVAAGVTTLDATRRDTSIVYIPDPGITGGSASVTVT